MREKMKNRGFSLIELLVVIVLIAIISIIAFVNFGNQSSKARNAMRLDNSGKILKAFQLQQLEEKIPSNECLAGSFDYTLSGTLSGTGCNVIIDGSSDSKSFLSKLKISGNFQDPANLKVINGDEFKYEFNYKLGGNQYEFVYLMEPKEDGSLININKTYALEYQSGSLNSLNIDGNFTSVDNIITPVILKDSNGNKLFSNLYSFKNGKIDSFNKSSDFNESLKNHVSFSGSLSSNQEPGTGNTINRISFFNNSTILKYNNKTGVPTDIVYNNSNFQFSYAGGKIYKDLNLIHTINNFKGWIGFYNGHLYYFTSNSSTNNTDIKYLTLGDNIIETLLYSGPNYIACNSNTEGCASEEQFGNGIVHGKLLGFINVRWKSWYGGPGYFFYVDMNTGVRSSNFSNLADTYSTSGGGYSSHATPFILYDKALDVIYYSYGGSETPHSPKDGQLKTLDLSGNVIENYTVKALPNTAISFNGPTGFRNGLNSVGGGSVTMLDENSIEYKLIGYKGVNYLQRIAGESHLALDDGAYKSEEINNNNTGIYIKVNATVPNGTDYKFYLANNNDEVLYIPADASTNGQVDFMMNRIQNRGGNQTFSNGVTTDSLLNDLQIGDLVNLGSDSYKVDNISDYGEGNFDIRFRKEDGSYPDKDFIKYIGQELKKGRKNFKEITKSKLDGNTLIDLNSEFGLNSNSLWYKIDLSGDNSDNTKTPIVNSVEFFNK